jgi:hypothetical protein
MKWILISGGAVLVGAVVAVLILRAREASRALRMAAVLSGSASRPAGGAVDFASFSRLPPPVARYFRHVLTDGQGLIRTAGLEQSGVLRTGTGAARWLPFTANHLAVPTAVGFVWNARVKMPLAAHVRVLDSYTGGKGSARVTLLSAFAVATESGAPELNSGALHRYLAEAVWFPTALLPQSGVVWSPMDDRSALATLAHRGTTVSLEFRFNEAGEVSGVYSPGRFGKFHGEYAKAPWEGRFRDYRVRAGMRIPLYGEVGWHENSVLELVWKGHILDVRYELER